MLEEKVDGANSGVSFSEAAELLLQSRGHYLAGGASERQFNLMKLWARAHEERFLDVREDRYVMYGEKDAAHRTTSWKPKRCNRLPGQCARRLSPAHRFRDRFSRGLVCVSRRETWRRSRAPTGRTWWRGGR